MDRLTFETVACLVDRGHNKLRVEVPQHEIAVLRAVHGQLEVKIIETDVDEIELEASAEAEWDRLVRTYARIGAPDPVRFVWPEGPMALEKYGFKSGLHVQDRETELRVINPKRRGRPKKQQAEASA